MTDLNADWLIKHGHVRYVTRSWSASRSAAGVTNDFINCALEGAISLLLTLLTGYCVARVGLIDHKTVTRVSKLCTQLFLPCLIVVQMGPHLTVSNLGKMWILPLWGLVSTIVAHLLGWLGKAFFKTRWWVIVAAGRPNTSALPLLLLQSLESTGVLDSLSADGESVKDTLSRAKSLILLNVVVQQTLTFQFAPAILKRDSKADGKSKGVEADVEGGDRLAEPVKRRGGNLNPVVQDSEHVGLLQDHNGRSYGTAEDGDDYPEALGLVADEPNVHWPKRLAILEKPVKATLSKMSPPLIGAMVALFIGLIPPLNHIFYDKDSPIHTSVTQSAENLGGLFVALQMFLVGSELALIPRARPGVIPTAYALLIRFIVMPGISLVFVWTTAGRGWYADDTLVWFLLVLIPAGPSAMLLASVAELVGIDEGPIAGYLTISYLFSPLMAAICSLGLIVVEKASKR